MKRIGYNREVAEAHGYEIRTDGQGHEHPVKKGTSATATAVVPFNTVPGECGPSFFDFTAPAHHTTMFKTGWTLNSGEAGAVDYAWQVTIRDDFGTSAKSFGRALASAHSRTDVGPFRSSGAGWVDGFVSVGLVVLWDGSICYSHGPSDRIYV